MTRTDMQQSSSQGNRDDGFPVQLVILLIIIFGIVLFGALKVIGLF